MKVIDLNLKSIIDFIELLLIVLGTIIGLFAAITETKDKLGNLTKWGKLAVIGIITTGCLSFTLSYLKILHQESSENIAKEEEIKKLKEQNAFQVEIIDKANASLSKQKIILNRTDTVLLSIDSSMLVQKNVLNMTNRQMYPFKDPYIFFSISINSESNYIKELCDVLNKKCIEIVEKYYLHKYYTDSAYKFFGMKNDTLPDEIFSPNHLVYGSFSVKNDSIIIKEIKFNPAFIPKDLYKQGWGEHLLLKIRMGNEFPDLTLGGRFFSKNLPEVKNNSSDLSLSLNFKKRRIRIIGRSSNCFIDTENGRIMSLIDLPGQNSEISIDGIPEEKSIVFESLYVAFGSQFVVIDCSRIKHLHSKSIYYYYRFKNSDISLKIPKKFYGK